MRLSESPHYLAARQWCQERRVGLTYSGASLLAIVAITLITLGVWSTWFKTHEEVAMLGERTWERQIEIEEFRSLDKESWSRPPSDAYDHWTSWEIHHWEQYISHYRTVTESYSCGSYETPRTCTRSRQEPVYAQRPVYDTRHHYKVDRWVTDEWVVVSGTELAPRWPDPPTGLSGAAVLGNRRVGDERKEDYDYAVSCDGCDEGQTVDLEFAEWSKLRQGQLVTAYVNSRGTVRGIDYER